MVPLNARFRLFSVLRTNLASLLHRTPVFPAPSLHSIIHSIAICGLLRQGIQGRSCHWAAQVALQNEQYVCPWHPQSPTILHNSSLFVSRFAIPSYNPSLTMLYFVHLGYDFFWTAPTPFLCCSCDPSFFRGSLGGYVWSMLYSRWVDALFSGFVLVWSSRRGIADSFGSPQGHALRGRCRAPCGTGLGRHSTMARSVQPFLRFARDHASQWSHVSSSSLHRSSRQNLRLRYGFSNSSQGMAQRRKGFRHHAKTTGRPRRRNSLTRMGSSPQKHGDNMETKFSRRWIYCSYSTMLNTQRRSCHRMHLPSRRSFRTIHLPPR